MTSELEENMGEINSQLEGLKNELIDVLKGRINKQTKEYFDVGLSNKLTDLCKQTKNIHATVKQNAEIPPLPPQISNNSIYANQVKIKNQVQYCNNLLRYTLKIYNIDFHNSNKMHELINYLEEIELAMNIFITNITSYLNNESLDTALFYKKGDYKNIKMKIQIKEGFFDLTGNKETIYQGDNIVLSAKFLDVNNQGVQGNLIRFYEQGNNNPIGSSITDSTGNANYIYTGTSSGEKKIIAESGEIQSSPFIFTVL